jgi:undecaprenyl-diphosphatase
MSIINATILGMVQGITEFLPISSSAHLVVIPIFLKQAYQGLNFDIALHIGTLSALVIYFFRDWCLLLKKGIVSPKSLNGKLFWHIVLASLPAAMVGFLFESQAETTLRNPSIISLALILGAVILLISDRKAKLKKQEYEITIKESIFIGIAQALAIIPGVSRSGITIAAGILSGLKRSAAAKFSFLLATPIILGAGLLRLNKLKLTELKLYFFIGMLSSIFTSLFSIHFLLTYLKKANLNIFIVYRILLGLIIIILAIR